MYEDLPVYQIAVWFEPDGWYWDDAEDHGGYDRISPNGPYASKVEAAKNAEFCYGGQIEIVYGQRPDYYE